MIEQYQVRKPSVIHEVFEDEVVIVNLDSGDYYSLSDAGVTCWNCLLTGCTLEQTVSVIGSEYEGDEDEIRASVQDLMGKLEKANLVVRSSSSSIPEIIENSASPTPKPTFVAPVLSGYSDMRDLLLIDPIHDVDESGWPQVKNESEDSAAG